jgi:hypothetical protein
VVSVEDKKELLDLVDETLDWLEEENAADATKDELDGKQKDVEQIANPVMRNLYSSGVKAGPEDDGVFYDSEF